MVAVGSVQSSKQEQFRAHCHLKISK